MGESQKTEYTTVFEGDGHDMDGVDVVRLEVWMLIKSGRCEEMLLWLKD
jgi:hypothetical protein